MEKEYIADCTTQVISAYVQTHDVGRDALAPLVSSVAKAFAEIGEERVEESAPEPAVNPSRSIRKDRLISLIDGKPYKMLKRHLSHHGMTPDDYRRTFGLPADYPMVAPEYAERRREIAIQNGLGRKPEDRKAA